MAENSVGIISLDLRINAELNKQINNIANMAGKKFSKVNDSMAKAMEPSRAIEKSFEKAGAKAKQSFEKGMGKITFSGFGEQKQGASAKELEAFSKPMEMSGGGAPESLISALDKIEDKAERLPEVFRASSDPLQLLRDKTANINLQIEEQTDKLKKLTEQYSKLSDEDMGAEAANKLGSAITSTESRLISLQHSLMTTQDKIRSSTEETFEGVEETVKRRMRKSRMHVNKFSAGVKKSVFALGKSVKRALKSAFLMAFLYAAFRGIKSLIGGAMGENEKFNNSLKQVKNNMLTAFAPIMYAIMPAINALAAGLAKVTALISAGVAAAFGKTRAEAAKMAESIKKAAKKAKGSVSGFEELNVLSSGDKKQDTGIDEVAENEGLLTSIGNKIKSMLEPIKNIDLSNIVTAFGKLKTAAEPLSSALFSGLEWLYFNILVPFGAWAIEDAIPTFFDALASVGKVLSSTLEALKPLGEWLWDRFLQPLAEWTGGILVSALADISSALEKIGNWIKNNQAAVEAISIVIGSFAAAWALVNVAIGVWNVVGVIATGVTGAFGTAVAILTSPITLVILAIGAIIAIIVLLVKNWDWVKEKSIQAWEGIKKAWTASVDFFKGIWDGIKGAFSAVGDWFKNLFTKAWQDVKNVFAVGGKIFSGIKEGLKDVFYTVVNALINGVNILIGAPFKAINAMLNKIRDISFLGLSPFKKLWGENPLPVPKIPKLARGGIIDQPTLAMVGERGKEAVMPLENNTGWIDQLAAKIAELIGGQGTGTPSEITIPIYLDGILSEEFIVDILNKIATRSNGRGVFA